MDSTPNVFGPEVSSTRKHNLEVKYSLPLTKNKIEEFNNFLKTCATYKATLQQTDTYYVVGTGRLKLREERAVEIDHISMRADLIHYERANQ